MANYTNATKIANHLGVALTVPQQAQAEVVAEAITVWIDHRTGRTWQNASGTVTDEVHQITGGVVYLEYRPVIAVSEVHAKPRGGGSVWELVPPSEYQLTDPAAGLLEFTSLTNIWAATYDARVDYTNAVAAPPADIAYAATVLSADVLFTMLHPESTGVQSLALGQNDIAITYASGADADHGGGVSMAVRIIDAYRRVVLA